MVTVVKTPQGHKIIDQAVTAAITDSSGDALVTFTAHALTTADHIYITSDIDEYNGFWYVEVINANTFKIRDNSLSDFVEYYQDAEIEYYQTQPHDWNSIFLPIIYKVSNDRWPVNSVDAVGLIVLNSDDNGFTTLTLAAPLAGLNAALEFVKITGATEEANGVWQVVEIITSNTITISLPYEFSGNLIGKAVQYYYNNYQVRVKVFAGLDATHPWESKKPYEEMAELSLTPDENNLVMFSVSDYIKSKVAIKNNLTLFSLPLNLDAFTGFYISTGESYDSSDNYSLYTTESSFTDDDFEGYTIAGKLPFKNVYSGDYADYVYTSGSPARWLTNHDRLLAVEDYYFDVSFIKNTTEAFFVRFSWYVTDYLTLIEDVQISDQGIGVYRIPVVPNTAYDSVCILARTNDIPEVPGVPEHTETILTPFNLAEGLNYDLDAPSGINLWDLGAIPEQEIISGDQPVTIYWPFLVANGVSYTFQYTIEITTVNIDTDVRVSLFDSSESYPGSTFAGTGANTHVSSGTFTDTITIVSTGTTPDVRFGVTPEAATYQVRLLAFGTTEDILVPAVPPVPAVPGIALTEEICIDILDTCEAAEGFTEEDRRLLEDGDFRLLE